MTSDFEKLLKQISGSSFACTRPWTRAYTLVEVLVVIAAIGILASILGGSFVNALSSTRSAACMNSLKQISSATTTYAGEFNGRWPFAGRDAGTGMPYLQAWTLVLDPYLSGSGDGDTSLWYLESSQVFYGCPELAYEGVTYDVVANSQKNWGDPIPDSHKRINYGLLGADATTSGYVFGLRSAADVVSPSKAVMYLDSYYQHNVNASNTAGWSEFSFTNLLEYRKALGVLNPGAGYKLRHAKGPNMAFVDGHVAPAEDLSLDNYNDFIQKYGDF